VPGPRKALTITTRKLVLHEAGYLCANPACRIPLTLDIHHVEYVSDGGGNAPDNLLPLCPNCHARRHSGAIPLESIRAWKMLLITLNEGFDRKSTNLLLEIYALEAVFCSGDGLLECAPLVASGLVECKIWHYPPPSPMAGQFGGYAVRLTSKGRLFVEAWKSGDQEAAVRAGMEPEGLANSPPAAISG